MKESPVSCGEWGLNDDTPEFIRAFAAEVDPAALHYWREWNRMYPMPPHVVKLLFPQAP